MASEGRRWHPKGGVQLILRNLSSGKTQGQAKALMGGWGRGPREGPILEGPRYSASSRDTSVTASLVYPQLSVAPGRLRPTPMA